MDNIVISLDTKFRNTQLYPNPAQFTFEFQDSIKNVGYISLSSIEFPNTFYTFTRKRGNTTFFIKTYYDEIIEIIILDGSYTSDLILNHIQDIFDNLIVNNITTQQFIISFNEITSRVSIKSTKPFDLDFENSSIYESLGSEEHTSELQSH